MNNNEFVSAKKRHIINTQKNINKILYGLNLNEFIHRIDMNIFYNDLKKYMMLHKILSVNVNICLKFDGSNNLNLYVYFMENGNEKAHFTMHLTGINYYKDAAGPHHLRLKNVVKMKNGTFKNAYSPIKVSHNKGKYKLFYNKMYGKFKFNLNYEINNNKEYKCILDLINDYLNEGSPISLTKNISGKRDILHPLFIKAENIKTSKEYYSRRGNGSKTLRKIHYKIFNPFKTHVKSRRSIRSHINLKNKNDLKRKYTNNKTGIEYNILKQNKHAKKLTKKSIKHYEDFKNTIIANDITNII